MGMYNAYKRKWADDMEAASRMGYLWHPATGPYILKNYYLDTTYTLKFCSAAGREAYDPSAIVYMLDTCLGNPRQYAVYGISASLSLIVTWIQMALTFTYSYIFNLCTQEAQHYTFI